MHPRLKSFLWWFIPLILFLALAFDGNTHWDETNYLYKGAFAPFSLSANWVHLSGGFYSGRIFHIFLIHSLFSILGIGIVSLFIIQVTMALCIAGAGVLYYFVLKEMDLPSPIPYFAAVVFLFLPLSLYLAFKSLAETTAIFMTALSIYLYLRGLKKEGLFGVMLWLLSASALFLATNSRVESLLTFTTLVIPFICFQSRWRGTALWGLVWVGLTWVVLTAGLGLLTGIWSVEFIIRRSAVYGAKFAADSMGYPANYVVAILFGGGLWLFALLSLFGIRRNGIKMAWGGLIVSMVPIAILADHVELRYFNPAIYSFSLAAAFGINVFLNWMKQKKTLLMARILTLSLFCILVASNQLACPFQEVGTSGFPLIRLMDRTRKSHDDALFVMSHPHSMYAFLRLCYPDDRIALMREFYGLAPLKMLDPADIIRQPGPKFYLTPLGPKSVPLLMRLRRILKGKAENRSVENKVAGNNWVTGADIFEFKEVDRESNYILYEITVADGN